jgi:hypothetical protein
MSGLESYSGRIKSQFTGKSMWQITRVFITRCLFQQGEHKNITLSIFKQLLSIYGIKQIHE